MAVMIILIHDSDDNDNSDLDSDDNALFLNQLFSSLSSLKATS